jgi:signal transduction histidine kinase
MFIENTEKSSILVVDADPGLQQELDKLFNGEANLADSTEEPSYIIDNCPNCRSAREAVYDKIAAHSPYQLAFIECHFSDGDGLALISDLWRLDPGLHIVICSADTQLNWQQIVDTVGESDQLLFLQKPYYQLALRQIVHALLRKWQLSQQSHHVMKFMELQINQRTQEIEEANRNLLQSEKLAAVGQLAAGIAHEINTPAQYVGDNISAIGSFFNSLTRMLNIYRQHLQNLGDPTVLAEIQKLEQQEDLKFILEDGPVAIEQSLQGMLQISQIVQAMKGFSHVGATTACRVNINKALENTLVVTRNSYKYIADVALNLAEIPSIECYAGELNQVFLNIIVNAAHAIEDSKKGRGLISIATSNQENGVEIRISDTGNGIPANIRDRIYDPFFTTKAFGRGSGQGLNIAYRIINQQHHGSLSFETETGVGTTFIIRLPKQLPKKLL